MVKKASILQRSKKEQRTTKAKPRPCLKPSKAARNIPIAPSAPLSQVKVHQRNAGEWKGTSAVSSQAAEIVKVVLDSAASGTGGANIKSLALAPRIKAKKATYAVVCETLRHLSLLKDIERRSSLTSKHPRLSLPTAYVLLFDLLLGEGLKPHGPAERVLLAEQNDLKSHMADSQAALGPILTPENSDSSHWPRYARVNLLKMTVKEALSWLRCPPDPHQGLQAMGQRVKSDELLPDLLHFPPGASLHDHPLVLQRKLILQSKASCMPAHILRPQQGWTVVDACAAPGNKTSHIAALMGGKGNVLAFDKDAGRCKRLQANMAAAGAVSVVAQCADFLSLDPSGPPFPASGVQAVLVDPSCSGSGTASSRLDHLLPSSSGQGNEASTSGEVTQVSAQRLHRLAAFQVKMLKHALHLPGLRRLVYSTCSIHAEENELVVQAILPEANMLGFHLANALPAWPRRGMPLVDGHEKLVRVLPQEDHTDGFFVMLFERTSIALA